MTNGNDAAHPRNYPGGAVNAKDVDAQYWERQYHGLTKRELFAAMAMEGQLARYGDVNGTLCMMAVAYADGLIAELNKCVPG